MSSSTADAAAAGATASGSPSRSPSPPTTPPSAAAPPTSAPPPSSSAPGDASSSTSAPATSSAGPNAAAPGASPPGSNMHPPGTFSSSPVAPVVASNHHRRWRSELGWIKPGSDNPRSNREDGASSPGDGPRALAPDRPAAARRSRSPSLDSSKSETSEEDIRAPRGASEAAAPGNSSGRPHGPPSRSFSPSNRVYGAGQVLSQLASQGGRESGQHHARSRSPSGSLEDEDEPSEHRAFQDSVRGLAYVDHSRTPSPVERDVQIVFKGREIFADDLIGLRVAKTFAGHGRFLGQVVKFDAPTSLYTVVYADGDAEDLSIENTLEILIQDEIERVDPSLPPPSSVQFFKRDGSSTGVDSPNGTESSDTAAREGSFRAQRSQSSGSSEHRASAIRISDREAQFVVGLFENHALPILLQQGWRVQSSPSGGEARYVAPGVSDGFSSSGAVFRSALDVVEYIASDNGLLTACFPTNVHSAILSLLPAPNRRRAPESSAGSSGPGARKRATADGPALDTFANKRHRQPRDDMYADTSGTHRASSLGASPHVENTMSGHAYRSAEFDYRMRERETGMRPGIPMERFAGVEPAPSRASSAVPGARQPYYTPSEYRGGHGRHLSDGSAPPSRWPGEPADPLASSKPVYHRRYEEPPRWRERDAPARGGYYVPEPSSADAVPRSYPRAERYYGGGYGGERTLSRPSFRGGRGELPLDYRYQGQEEAPMEASTDPYRRRYADAPPPRGGYADSRQVDGSMELSAGRMPRDSPGISMMDVDRLASSRGGGGARSVQSAGRSPRGGVDTSAPYGAFRGQYASQRGGAADMDVSSDAPTPRDEERAV